MFVKKLVEKASKKDAQEIEGGTRRPCGLINVRVTRKSNTLFIFLRAEDVSPRLAFHYGVPGDAALLAYDPIIHVLAVATRNGQIKLFGRDNTQVLLQCPGPLSSKFLRFVEGHGVLLNVNTRNQIEASFLVWDIDTKKLCYVHPFEKEVTAISVLQKSFYIYVGDNSGSVSLLKLDLAQRCLSDMPYWIPFAESYGSAANVDNEVEVIFVSPQPLAEHNRLLIIFRDGIMILWDIKASKVVSISGKTMQQLTHQEAKTVTSACWVCAKGTKIAIGYDNGDLYIWALCEVLTAQNSSSMGSQNLPLQRLNLGYKLDKMPIVSLQWVPNDGKAGRLYINGFNDQGHLFQNEDNTLSGSPITSLQFDFFSCILVSGDKSGTVRVMAFKKDSSDNIFSFLQAKQGDDYNVRSIKLKGAVTTTSLISKSKHFAAGTEKGIVSVINTEDGSILYQKQFECRLSGGIASLQFETYSHNGYDKDILIIAMEDSSMFILEEETGKLLNTNPVQTDKPAKALLLQVLESTPDDASVSNNQDTVSKEPLLLLCTENAIRLFSLSHAIQGTKKIINKKKFSGNCCFASLIHSSSEIGLALVFSNGEIEIRHTDSINKVYRKDNWPREESSYVVKSPKEKKKGLFGMIMKDNKGNKEKESSANVTELCVSTTPEELASIFSTANFAPLSERRNSSLKDEENIELDIDDIDIDGDTQKQKGPHFPVLSKEKISKGFQTLRGKLKPKTEEKVNFGNKKPEDESSISQVDQIKMKYGYATNDDSTSVPKMIGNKLQENIKKLEGINHRAADMANGAQSFSAMAKELLQTTKNEKSTS
ncbi:hypothetical protein PR202_ga19360 [Eleusine coracana subsp. coracana]|uniref:Lethal giant larvae (Lgl)-like C-terminal domain-containing protein n=1 Tax=Eleusine coracana subsp. coracana TaxID=191504 RepID=A0AAV5CVE6_ELECO|nr:hypothetical protein PR202_ga19360 [Eleusine coracana subsp. coracana]